MARGNSGKGLSLVVLTAVLGVGSSLLLLVLLATQGDTPPPDATSEKTPPAAQPDPAGAAALPRRLKVAGNEGYAVVINPDGSSFLEEPDGTRKTLTGPGRADEDAAKKVEEKLEQVRPKRAGLGQLVVTETGIVDVPKDAVITLVGKDRVVTHDPDGTSKVYFVDGRVVAQARGARSGRTP